MIRPNAIDQLGLVNAKNVKQALKASDLDWKSKKDALINPRTDEPMTDTFGIFRSDNNALLGTVKGKYTAIDNEDIFNVLNPFVEAGAKVSHAGHLKNGAKVFMAVETNGFEVMEGDLHRNFITMTSSHDGSMSVGAGLTNVRIICQNTFMYATKELSKQLKFKHTPNGTAKLELIKDYMANVAKQEENLLELFGELCKRKITSEHVNRIRAELFPLAPEDAKDTMKTRRQNARDAFDAIFANQDGAFKLKDTAYNLFNAVTEYNSHLATVKAGGDEAKEERESAKAQRRAESVLFESLADANTGALQLILKETADAKHYTPKGLVLQSIMPNDARLLNAITEGIN